MIARRSQPAPPPLARVLETALYVADLARSRAFYADVLGGRVLLDTPRLVALAVGVGDGAAASGASSVLLLFRRGASDAPMPTDGGVVPGHGAAGVQHFAFAIARDQRDAWVAHLEAAGVPLESRVTWARGGESLYVRDPDGHSVELATPGVWAVY